MNHLKTRKALSLAALVALGLAGGYLLAALLSDDAPDAPATVAERDAVGADAMAEAPQVYTCSMHPQVRMTDPDAQCPICGMDLIPVATDEVEDGQGMAGGPRLELSPRSAALMQLEVLPATRRHLEVPVRLFGQLEHAETRLRTIAAWVPGRLEKLHVDFTGVTVRQGQPMAELFSPKLIAAQEELLQALAAARELEEGGTGIVQETTRLTVQAARDRLRLLGLKPSQVDRLESRGRVEERVTVPAPVSGVVLERLAEQGDYVQTGDPIYRLADLSVLWAQLEVYESELRWLSVGQEVHFTLPSYPGERFSGTVSFIDPTIDPRSRTASLRVEVENAGDRLKPGMFLNGTVQAGLDSPGLVIPASAPLVTGQRAVVYVQDRHAEQPVFEPRDVLLGARAGDWYLVEEGLEEGELVVARGAFKIDSELQIRGRPSMMQPEGGAPPTHDHGGHQMDVETVSATGEDAAAGSAPEGFQVTLGALVRSQFELVEALAGDDPATAREAALAVDEALHGVDAELLEGAEARRGWNRLAQTMHDALGEVGRSAGLEAQRRHFESFSDALTEAVQDFGIADAGPVYRAMCPMVQGRVGYWLQQDQQVANPYFGASMLRCGEIIETLSDDAARDGGEDHEGHGS